MVFPEKASLLGGRLAEPAPPLPVTVGDRAVPVVQPQLVVNPSVRACWRSESLSGNRACGICIVSAGASLCRNIFLFWGLGTGKIIFSGHLPT